MRHTSTAVVLGLLCWLWSGAAVLRAQTDAPDTRATTREVLPADPAAFADIASWYSHPEWRPNWTKPFADLRSTDPAIRAAATSYFLALVAHLRDDQLNGRSPILPNAAWGRSGTILALDRRDQAVQGLATSPVAPASIEVLAWVIEHETVSRITDRAIGGITSLRTAETDRLLLRCVDEGLGGAAVVAQALSACADRGLQPSHAGLERCLQSLRRSLREAAAPLAKRAGLSIPPAPVLAAIFQTPDGAALMPRLVALAGAPPPPRAPWVEIDAGSPDNPAAPPGPTLHRGWRLAETPDLVEIETLHGYPRQIAFRPAWPMEKETRRYRIASLSAEVERVVSVRAALTQPNAANVDDLRSRLDLLGSLSDDGSLTAQFEPAGWSLYEFMLGIRLYQFDRRDEAARVLLPVIEANPSDEDCVSGVEWFLGDARGHTMIARFAEHDLGGTLAAASEISRLMPRSRFARLALRLTKEIPRRKGDWDTFRLPTAEDWERLSAPLKRDEQIRYLCARVRLVTGLQAGLISIGAEQLTQYEAAGCADHRATLLTHANASGKADPAAVFRSITGHPQPGDPVTVINPLKVLLNGPLAPREPGDRPSGVGPADLAVLRECAAQEDWVVPSATAWRGFHADRRLSTTAELIEGIAAQLK